MASIRRALRKRADAEKRAFLPRFFKTGPGEYGEGDQFLGVTVPKCREVARLSLGADRAALTELLASSVHEERFVALAILVERFKRDETQRDWVYRFYVKQWKSVNNWDLVDLTAHVIIGGYWEGREAELEPILLKWARSPNLWRRRIAMMSTFHSIKRSQSRLGLRLAEALVNDEHDLIHKAVGWMLREIGKRDLASEERFLKKHARRMPRTMLRYAIEKFPEPKRKAYLDGTFGD